MNRITKQLLKEISNLQEQLAEEKQRNKNTKESLETYKRIVNRVEEEKEKEKKKKYMHF